MTVGVATLIYAGVGAVLVVIGAYHVIVLQHPLRKLVALNVFGSGIFLILVAGGARTPGSSADPVPHAMVLTGLVVAVSATALGLVLALRLESADSAGERGDAGP